MLAGMFADGQSLEARVRKALFSVSELGWMYSIHPSHVRSSSDGTGAVAAGDPVGWIEDMSGNTHHATQDTASARPLLMLDGAGHYFLRSDGADDWMMFPTISTTSAMPRLIAAALKHNQAGTRIMYGMTTQASGYLGQVSGFHQWRDAGFITSPVAGSTLATLVCYSTTAQSGLVTNGDDTPGTGIAGVRNYHTLFCNGVPPNTLSSIDYYGGLINIREPSPQDIALVTRWLNQLRGA